MLVSVILPVYNGAEYLPQAIDSVLNQTQSSLELLISDDGSTDGSWELIQRYAGQDRRIKPWRNNIQLGLFGNYNRTMRKASGDFIKLFAQDDLLSPATLGTLSEALQNNRSAVLAACGRTVIGDKQDARSTSAALPSGLNPGKSVIVKCLAAYRNLIGEPVTVLFRRDHRHMEFKESYLSLGDLELWLRFLELGDLVYIPEALVTFRQHEESQTQRLLSDLDWVLDFLQLSRDYADYLEELGISRQDYCSRFIELAAPLVEANIRTDPDFVDALPLQKELNYYLLRRLPSALKGEANYRSMLESTSWRVTRPLRLLKKKLGSGKS